MALSAYALITLADLKTHLGITDASSDALLEAAIERATAMIETFLGRKIVSRTYTEWRNTTGQRTVAVRNPPIINATFVGIGDKTVATVQSTLASDIAVTLSITDTGFSTYRMTSAGTAVTTDGVFASYPSVSSLVAKLNTLTGYSASTVEDGPSRWMHRIGGFNLKESIAHLTSPRDTVNDYVVQHESGLLHANSSIWGKTWGRFPMRPQGVLIEYTGGYATVPYDIQQAALEVSSGIFRNRLRDPALNNESLGDYSYGLKDAAAMTADMKRLLDGYRRIL